MDDFDEEISEDDDEYDDENKELRLKNTRKSIFVDQETMIRHAKEDNFEDPHLLRLQHKSRRKSTLVCTIAEPTITHVELQKMMETGMNVVNIKMSHFTNEQKIQMLSKVERAAEACCKKYGLPEWPIATCVELKTCNTKTGLIPDNLDFITIEEGTEVILTNSITKYNRCSQNEIFVDTQFLKENIKVGNEISIKEDEVILKVVQQLTDNSVKCVVTKGGILSNIEHVAMKGEDYAEPFLSKRDQAILQFSLKHKIDMIMINYVRSAETLKMVKHFMKNITQRPALFAGICTNQCIENIDSILREADGIILPRNILCYELPHEQKINMVRIQKWLCAKCLKAGKALYVSGGIFDEAVRAGIFYDTEVFDISNAVLDGASGFILNDCFDSDYTNQTIKIVNDICELIENLAGPHATFWRMIEEIPIPVNAAKAAAIGCLGIVNQMYAKAIIIPTVSGLTAKFLLNLCPSCLVYTVSTSNRVLRRLASYRCVVPLLYTDTKFNKRWTQVIRDRVNYAVEYGVKKGYLGYGENYVTLHRGKDSSPYCDTIQCFPVSVYSKTAIVCPY